MIAVGWTGNYEWTPNNVALGIVMVGAAWLGARIISGDRRAIIGSLAACSLCAGGIWAKANQLLGRPQFGCVSAQF